MAHQYFPLVERMDSRSDGRARNVSMLDELGIGDEEEDEEEDEVDDDVETCDDSLDEESDSEDDSDFTAAEKLRIEFEKVLQLERERIAEDFEQRYGAGLPRGTPFSIALSGGGIRATAFQSGVLWRLAEEGRLKDVEHISAVSGGSWAAMGFASHLVRAVQPQAGTDLNLWYLDIVAKAICRMVHNVPYLARDLGKDPFSIPHDGSSTLPRVFDLPILFVTLITSLMVRPLCHTALYLIPFIELMDMFFGAEMREMFCWTSNWADHWDRWPMFELCRLPLGLFILASAGAFLLQALSVSKSVCRPGSTGWLFAQASFAVLARVAAAMVFVIITVGLTSFLETWAYTTKGVRREVCQDYILNASERLVCHDRPLRQPIPWYSEEVYHEFYKENRAASNISNLVPGWEFIFPNYSAAVAWNTALTPVNGPTVMRSLVDSVLPATLASLACLLLLTLVCVPFYPQNFLHVLNVAGPIVVLSIVCSAVQWRVFGPVTNQHFLSFVQLPFENEMWHKLYTGSLIITMVVLPFYYFIRGNAHRFYRRSLRMAFFAAGKHITWGDLQSNHFCPIIILSATVTDYIIPGEKLPINPISFTPLHLGGCRLGFVKMKSCSIVAKAMAMSGAAPDAVVLARSQQLRSRFWLEVLGVGVGQHVQFDTINNRQKIPLLWFLRKRLEGQKKELPDIFYRIPSVVMFEVVYTLLLVSEMVIHKLQYCVSGRLIFYCGMCFSAFTVTLSFYAFLPQLDFLLHSAVIRTIHQVTGYYHKARSPPSLLYVTDGMVEDNTGVMDLLRRQRERILLVYAGGDPKDEFKFLLKLSEAAGAAKLASLYDLENPRNDIRVAIDRYRQGTGRRFLELGILYGWDEPPEFRKAGRLVILKIHLPQALQDMPVQPLLTEAEIKGEDHRQASKSAGSSSPRRRKADGAPNKPKRARDLSGCCCDCCHRAGMKCGSMFPFPPTGVQFLTPQVTSSLCRLGHSISDGVVEAVCAPLEEPC